MIMTNITNYKEKFLEFCKQNSFNISEIQLKLKNKEFTKAEFKQLIKDFIDKSSYQAEIGANFTEIKKGDVLNLSKLIYIQKFTQPPSRYSAASLIKKLEELGIGRPSTYATIISTLQDRGYVESGQGMKPSTLGMQVNNVLKDNFADVTSSGMTAEMESNLDKISRGELSYEDILNDFWWDFKKNVESKAVEIKGSVAKYRSSKTDVRCPTCNSEMELKIGRFGEYFQCLATHQHQFPKNFREYEQALSLATKEYESQAKGQICQECGKDMIVRVSKSSLKPYIACPDYRVGNKHTITNVVSSDSKDQNGNKEKRFKRTKKVVKKSSKK
jgi:ssDNA-binding Zn-finger/Zn-ribbon topoisomerase 1